MVDVCFVELRGFTKEVMPRTRVEGFAKKPRWSGR
jgi:hypothetical protein